MIVEPSTNEAATVPTGSTQRWADDGGVLTEERHPEPESVHPDTSFEVVGSENPTAIETEALEGAGAVTETSMEATSDPVVREPLLTDAAEQTFLSRWAEIQVGFVEDPAQSVQDADGLIGEIATALLESFRARRTDLAADWRDGSPGTEELRLALRRYRAFIGVVLPK
jgi:hypothetical protein